MSRADRDRKTQIMYDPANPGSVPAPPSQVHCPSHCQALMRDKWNDLAFDQRRSGREVQAQSVLDTNGVDYLAAVVHFSSYEPLGFSLSGFDDFRLAPSFRDRVVVLGWEAMGDLSAIQADRDSFKTEGAGTCLRDVTG